MGEQQISSSMFESHEYLGPVRFMPCINIPEGHFAHTLLLQNGGRHEPLAINHSMMTKIKPVNNSNKNNNSNNSNNDNNNPKPLGH